jgi:hypothetical protein
MGVTTAFTLAEDGGLPLTSRREPPLMTTWAVEPVTVNVAPTVGSNEDGVVAPLGTICTMTDVSTVEMTWTVRDWGAKAARVNDTTLVPLGIVGIAKLPWESVVVLRLPARTVTPGIGEAVLASTTRPIRPWISEPGRPKAGGPNGRASTLLDVSPPPPQESRRDANPAVSAPNHAFFIIPPSPAAGFAGDTTSKAASRQADYYM